MSSRALLLVAAVLAATGGCGGEEELPGDASPAGTSPTRPANCVAADSSIMAPLGNRLANGVRARSGFLVREGEVYYLSAELDGPDLEEDGDVATWVTTDRYGSAPLYAVDDLAKEHGDWTAAEDADLVIDDDARDASRTCVSG